jgi:hypothetical protein
MKKVIKYLNSTTIRLNNRRISIMPHSCDITTKNEINLVVFRKLLKGDVFNILKDTHKNTIDRYIKTNKSNTKGILVTRILLSNESLESLYYIYNINKKKTNKPCN